MITQASPNSRWNGSNQYSDMFDDKDVHQGSSSNVASGDSAFDCYHWRDDEAAASSVSAGLLLVVIIQSGMR